MAQYHRISVQVQASRRAHLVDQRLVRACRVCALLLLAWAVASPTHAQDTTPRWRAAFVDTFSSRLGSPDEVAAAVARASALSANVLYVQVRRRGDAFYLDGSEPAPEGVAIDGAFDPLGDLLAKARTAGIDVHAVVTLGPVWHLGTAPADPRHVFTRHGFQGGRAVEGTENWLTRTLQPDGNGTSMEGYRFANDYWLDFGHPAAVNYVADLLTRLVERYPVDGVRLDAVHYPEAPGGTASIGYNAVSLARYRARTGQAGLPGPDDPGWGDWRREQITALTRRLALTAMAVRPSLVVSVSAVAAGAAPGDERGTVAYSRTFQNWFPWASDGSVDVVVPQAYRAEHASATAAEFAGWMAWLGSRAPARALVIGLGAYQNSLEGLVRQARAAQSAAGPQGGVSFFSLAATNAPVVNNPLSTPAGRDTPQRPFEDFAAALRTGRTVGGQAIEPPQPPLFAVPVARPATPWKDVVGHLLGRVEDSTGAPVDGAQVRLDGPGRSAGPADVVSDGSGIFATPSVTPGTYRVLLLSPAGGAYTSDCTVDVPARAVTRVTLVLDAARAGTAACR